MDGFTARSFAKRCGKNLRFNGAESALCNKATLGVEKAPETTKLVPLRTAQ